MYKINVIVYMNWVIISYQNDLNIVILHFPAVYWALKANRSLGLNIGLRGDCICQGRGLSLYYAWLRKTVLHAPYRMR